MKKLFIYYSLTGNGDEVAKTLEEKGYEIRKVKSKIKYPKSLVPLMMKGGHRALTEKKDELEDFDTDITKYDKIVIGSPVWDDRLAPATNTMLDVLDLKDKDPELANQMVKTADDCDQKLKEIEDGKKRRNIWLIVGGILLMVLMFVGNQTFNHFRNLKNQKGIEKMQNSIAKRAQDEARRRAQSMARSKINKVQSQIRQKSRDSVRNSVNSAVNSAVKGVKGKNKKSVSI